EGPGRRWDRRGWVPSPSSSLLRPRSVHADPDGETSQYAHAHDPDEHAVHHRAEAAAAEAAVVALLLHGLDVRDDLALVLGGQHLAGEDRHLRRAGQHGLVDVDRVDVLQARRIAAARQGAAGTDRVVARGAVGAEELAATGDALLVDALPVEVRL